MLRDVSLPASGLALAPACGRPDPKNDFPPAAADRFAHPLQKYTPHTSGLTLCERCADLRCAHQLPLQKYTLTTPWVWLVKM